MKVLQNEVTNEITQEMEDMMRQSYPHLFLGKSNFRGRKFYKLGGM